MNLTTILAALKTAGAAAKKAKTAYDGLFAIFSLFAVPAAATSVIFWYFEGPGSMHASHSSMKAKAGEAAHLSSELQFTAKPLKVFYQLELVDEEGHIAFQYPVASSRGVPQLDNMLIQVPASVRPGNYSLIAQVRYAVNPIKAQDQTVQVASITVD
jgi:hypothetical protein